MGATKRAVEVTAVHCAGQSIIAICVGVTAHGVVDRLMNACAQLTAVERTGIAVIATEVVVTTIRCRCVVALAVDTAC